MTDTSLIPTAALARELGVNRRTLARWAASGELPGPMIFHGRLYFLRGEIDAWKKSLGNARVIKSAVCDNDRLMLKSHVHGK